VSMRVCVVVIAALALSLAGCGGGRSHPLAPVSPPPAASDAVREPASADVPGGAAQPAPGDFGNAALNRRLLSRTTPPSAESDLPLGAGDLVEVSVFEVEELSKLKVRVSRRGTVTLPLVGSVTAAARTPDELEGEIRDRLQQKYMHQPQVSVFVIEHASQRVAILGAVRKGGVQPLTGRLRLADALAMAEGLADDADHTVFLIRRVPSGTVVRAQAGIPAPQPGSDAGTETEEVMVKIDLDALANGRDELNVALQPGDVVHVPRAGSFYVGGSVAKPGSFLLRRRTTVDQAILAAGGVKNVADWEDVRLYREKPDGQREVLTFSLTEFEKGKPAAELQQNDVVIVGESGSKAFWYGFRDFFQGVFGISKGL
jgi:polysaccharide export outer membrane protein